MRVVALFIVSLVMAGCVSIQNKLVDAASGYGSAEISDMQSLLDSGADINMPEVYDYQTNRQYLQSTALHATIYDCDLARFKFLVSKGADLNKMIFNERDPRYKRWDGDHALHVATDEGCLNIVTYLIDEIKVPIDTRERTFEKTPLMIAVAMHDEQSPSNISVSRLEMVEFLISRGADVHATNKYNENVLHLVSTGFHKTNMKVLKMFRQLSPTKMCIDRLN